MKAMPHNPPVQNFEITFDLLPELIRDKEGQQEHVPTEDLPAFLVEFAELWFVRAQLAYLFGEPAEGIVRYLWRGLEEAKKASVFGHETNPWRMWDYLSSSLAAGDYPSAHFFSSLSENRVWNPAHKPVPWLVLQVQVLAAIFQSGEHPGRVARLQELYEAVFRVQLPEELNDQLPEIRNTYATLDALAAGNAKEFNSHLSMRMDILSRYFSKQNTSATAALIDLHGLGLCRLARRRGMEVAVRHVYLPLELLQAFTPSAAPRI